jgi:hypothetical protein
MARKVGQIIARGDRKWLIRVYLGRDHETKKRNYHNRTIRGYADNFRSPEIYADPWYGSVCL